MVSFELDEYSETVQKLLGETLNQNRQGAIGPGTPNRAARELLVAATPGDVAPQARSPEMASCCLSGLWLWHDFLDESHQICQDLPTAEGSYWHGIMHRREPDYANSKYWYRRVGDHPIFPDLLEQAHEVAKQSDSSRSVDSLVTASHWDPCAFVDLCADAARSGNNVPFCQEVGAREWLLLFDYCYGR